MELSEQGIEENSCYGDEKKLYNVYFMQEFKFSEILDLVKQICEKYKLPMEDVTIEPDAIYNDGGEVFRLRWEK